MGQWEGAERPARGGTFVCDPIWVPVDLGWGMHVGSVRAQEPARKLFGSLRAGLWGWDTSPVTIDLGRDSCANDEGQDGATCSLMGALEASKAWITLTRPVGSSRGAPEQTCDQHSVCLGACS